MHVTTVHQIQALVRERRHDLGLSQLSLAESAGVSRKWLSDFERGATTAVELPLVLRVLAALDLTLDVAPAEVTQPSSGDNVDLDWFLADYASRSRASWTS